MERIMKKALALILVLVMAVGLFAGCKKADEASVYYLTFKPHGRLLSSFLLLLALFLPLV